MNQNDVALTDLARELRLDILDSTTRAGSGHPSSSWSAVEIVTAPSERHSQNDSRRKHTQNPIRAVAHRRVPPEAERSHKFPISTV